MTQASLSREAGERSKKTSLGCKQVLYYCIKAPGWLHSSVDGRTDDAILL